MNCTPKILLGKFVAKMVLLEPCQWRKSANITRKRIWKAEIQKSGYVCKPKLLGL